MISFRPLKEADSGLLFIWMSSPHVRQWWHHEGSTPDDEVEEALGLIGASEGAAFVVEYNRKPVGYIQHYDAASGDEGFYFAGQPKGAQGVDMFIGDVSLTGQGLGPQILRQFGDGLLEGGAPKLLVDPDADNEIAIRCYQKAGFDIYEQHDSPRWGRVTLMHRVK